MKNNNLMVAGQYNYFLKDCLGKGAWGAVYKAVHSTNRMTVALKKMNKFQIESNQDTFQKLESQITLLQQVSDCDKIIKFIDVFRTESNYYIITEYIEGSCDLLKYMETKEKVFTEFEARKLWTQLLQGVVYLHQRGIMHRDLKLQNLIFVEAKDEIKIIDFGLAVTIQSQDTSGGMVGSPLFMSPQVLKRQPYSHKCDIWSLGIIFYYMLCGESPYRNAKSIKEIEAAMQELRKGIFELSYKLISEECKDIIMKCLTYSEADRPEASQLLKHAFFTKKHSYVAELYGVPNFVPLSDFLNPNSFN